jgi:hypothetical protein
VREALAKLVDVKLHVVKLDDGRYLYWFIGDEVHAIREAMGKFSHEDGMDVAADEVVSLIKERGSPFSKVYISGYKDKTIANKDKVIRIISNKDEWKKALEEGDESILAIDLLGFGASERRNNLFVVRPNDKAALPAEAKEMLAKLTTVSGIRDGIANLGIVVKAADEVARNLPTYFPDLFNEERTRLLKEMEQWLRSRVEQWEDGARRYLRRAVAVWLGAVTAGFKEFEKPLDEFLSEVARGKSDMPPQIIRALFKGDIVSWDSFKKLGDLWSVYLHNENMPSAPYLL